MIETFINMTISTITTVSMFVKEPSKIVIQGGLILVDCTLRRGLCKPPQERLGWCFSIKNNSCFFNSLK